MADIRGAVDAGADAVGVIFAESPRRVSLADAGALIAAVPSFVSPVAVLVDPDEPFVAEVRALGFVPQFHGGEPPGFTERTGGDRYVKALHVEAGAVSLSAELLDRATAYAHADLLFDTRAGALAGGSGVAFTWSLVQPLARRRRVIVSGGLTPANVAACVATVRPFAVDVRSGVEAHGVKDLELMRAFVRAVRETDGHT